MMNFPSYRDRLRANPRLEKQQTGDGSGPFTGLGWLTPNRLLRS